MKKLQDLKQELIEGKVNKFYVFYGEDYGIRKHYINKIATFFDSTVVVDSCEKVGAMTVAKSLFKIRKLIVVYDDQVFAKKSNEVIQTFIKRLNDYCVILVYEQPLENSNLFKNFSDYITYFPVVQDNIAKEFVESEVSLFQTNQEQLAKDCVNNYNNILLESDKIKQYGQAKNLTDEHSYESLKLKEQMLENIDTFDSNLFMDDILTGMFTNIPYWIHIINKKEENNDKFYFSLTSMLNDCLIASLISKYGKYDGGSRAYNYGLPWGRTKTIRELNLYYNYEQLLELAFFISEIDSKVKTGQLLRENVLNYFLEFVI